MGVIDLLLQQNTRRRSVDSTAVKILALIFSVVIEIMMKHSVET